MKLPWDRNYIKISFHVIFTILIIGVCALFFIGLPQSIEYVRIFFGNAFSVAAPLIYAVVIAFLLDPVVDMFEDRLSFIFKKRKNKNRLFGTILTYLTLFLILALIVTMAVKKLGVTDINRFAYALNIYIQDLSDMLLTFQKALSGMGVLSTLNGVINDTIINVTRTVKISVLSAAGAVASLGGTALKVGIGLVAAFYFLTEKETIILKLKRVSHAFFSYKNHKMLCEFFQNVNAVFSGYVTGQIIDAFIMASLLTLSFWAAGIKYAVFIGIVSGFSNLIPYIGALVAFVLSVLIGLIGGTPAKAVYAAVIVIILQQIDSMIIVPKVLGKSVKLHPVLVILALSVFGSVFGIMGMVVAVPVTALIKIYFDKELVKRERLKIQE